MSSARRSRFAPDSRLLVAIVLAGTLAPSAVRAALTSAGTRAVLTDAGSRGAVTDAGVRGAITDAGATATASNAASESASGCVERLAEGAERPQMHVTFPNRQTSGYASTLHIEVVHQRGESVLPDTLVVDQQSDSAKQLKAAQFVFPDHTGDFAPKVTRDDEAAADKTAKTEVGDKVTSQIDLPLVPLPKMAGRNYLVLPALPIAVARKNGEVSTLCTPPQNVTVEDPTADTPEATPRPNPPPLPQREEWTALRHVVEWGTFGLLAAAVVAYVSYKIAKRPKPTPPPPPPRPPWEIALEQLRTIRYSTMLADESYEEYTDRVSDAVRGYLGGRYGFDGLESTTDEIVRALRRASLRDITHAEVNAFLQESDMVKFAAQATSRAECEKLLAWAETIVRNTMPRDLGLDHRTAQPPPPNPNPNPTANPNPNPIASPTQSASPNANPDPPEPRGDA